MGANTDLNNFTVYRGDDFNVTLNFTDTASEIIPITGWTIFFTLKKKIDDSDSDAIISKTITALTDPTHGVANVTVLASELTTLVGPYYYDFQFENASGGIYTITSGIVIFMKDVTRRIA